MYERFGINVTLITAGEHKGEGNPFEPLSDEDRAAFQAQVDHFYNQFTSAIAKYRGVSASAVRSVASMR